MGVPFVGALVAVVIGAVIAVSTVIALVQVANGNKPEPVSKPLIVYGVR